jgi:flagellin-like hook-associated protein FlgL
LRDQLGQLANDATYLGTGLVQENPDSLTVSLNETGTSQVTVNGAASDAGGLGIGDALSSYNNFASDADIESALNDLSAATASLRSTASSFGSDVALLGIREDFAANLGSTLEGGAAKLVNADLHEEAARQLSSQVRQNLSTLGLRIAAQSSQQVAQTLFAN